MTTSYFAAAPILSEVAGRDLARAAVRWQARKRALMDFLDHGLHTSQESEASMTGRKFLMLIWP